MPGRSYITGSGSNWTPGAQYWVRCYDGGGTFVNTSTNTPVVYSPRYVDGAGNLSWGGAPNGICFSPTATSVEVWTSSGQSRTASI